MFQNLTGYAKAARLVQLTASNPEARTDALALLRMLGREYVETYSIERLPESNLILILDAVCRVASERHWAHSTLSTRDDAAIASIVRHATIDAIRIFPAANEPMATAEMRTA